MTDNFESRLQSGIMILDGAMGTLLLEALRHLLRTCRLNIIGGCCGTTPEHIHALTVD